MRPWTPEERAAKSRKIVKEAERARVRLGATTAYIIVSWSEGEEHLHVLSGGSVPFNNEEEMLKQVLSGVQRLKESGGEDVSIN